MVHVVRHEFRRVRALLIIGPVAPLVAVAERYAASWLGGPGICSAYLCLAVGAVVAGLACTWHAAAAGKEPEPLTMLPISRGRVWLVRTAVGAIALAWTLAWVWLATALRLDPDPEESALLGTRLTRWARADRGSGACAHGPAAFRAVK